MYDGVKETQDGYVIINLAPMGIIYPSSYRWAKVCTALSTSVCFGNGDLQVKIAFTSKNIHTGQTARLENRKQKTMSKRGHPVGQGIHQDYKFPVSGCTILGNLHSEQCVYFSYGQFGVVNMLLVLMIDN